MRPRSPTASMVKQAAGPHCSTSSIASTQAIENRLRVRGRVPDQGDAEKSLSFAGKYFNFDKVPIEIWPAQKPHPPIWYGVHSRPAAACTPSASIRRRTPSSRPSAISRPGGRRAARLPKLGLGRFIVVADTDADALALARRAYPKWHHAFTFLPRMHGIVQQHPRPADFDTLVARGQGFAGSPASVTAWLRAQLDATATNYMVGQFALWSGSSRSATSRRRNSPAQSSFFATHVMPALRAVTKMNSRACACVARSLLPRRTASIHLLGLHPARGQSRVMPKTACRPEAFGNAT